MAYHTETISITINGETRELECTVITHDGKPYQAYTDDRDVAIYRKGSGKVWERCVTLWPTKDGEWRVDHNACIMNRNGYRLIGWNQNRVPESAKSKHNSA